MNLLLYIGTLFCWGTSWYFISLQLGSVAPSISVAWRFVLASGLLFAWCLIRRKGLRFDRASHRRMALTGLLLFSTNFYLVYLGTQYLTTGLVCLVFSTVTLFIVFGGYLLYGYPIRPKVLLGSLVGVAGLGVVFGNEIVSADFSQGLGWCLLGTLSAALGMLYSGRNQARQLPLVESNAWGMLYGAGFMLVFALASGATPELDISFRYLGPLVYLALVASVAGFGCYLTLLGRIGADKASYVNVFTPLVALSISTLMEGFAWTPTAGAGVALVLVGNILVLYNKGKAS